MVVPARHDADPTLTARALLRRPTGYLPLVMSAGALGMIAWFVAAHGVARQVDEGAQVHLWQLLVAGQVPLIAAFALHWLPRTPRAALVVLLQVATVLLVAIAPLWALGGL